MAFFRQYIAPLFIFALFFVALAAVSARIFLPADMAGPAIMDEPVPAVSTATPGMLPQPSRAWVK